MIDLVDVSSALKDRLLDFVRDPAVYLNPELCSTCSSPGRVQGLGLGGGQASWGLGKRGRPYKLQMNPLKLLFVGFGSRAQRFAAAQGGLGGLQCFFFSFFGVQGWGPRP